MNSRVGAVEKRLDLTMMLLGRGPHDHVLQWGEQLAIVGPVGVNHGRQPTVRQRSHAFGKCQVHENLAAQLFPLAPRMNAGIDQAEPHDAIGVQHGPSRAPLARPSNGPITTTGPSVNASAEWAMLSMESCCDRSAHEGFPRTARGPRPAQPRYLHRREGPEPATIFSRLFIVRAVTRDYGRMEKQVNRRELTPAIRSNEGSRDNS